MDIVGCAQAENLHWEARIARAEQLLMVRMDAEGQRFLVDAARAWPAYRDAVCAARAYAEAAGGTLSQIIGSHCRVDLSALRAHELEGMLGR